MTRRRDSDDDTLPDIPVVRAAERGTVVMQRRVAAWGASSSLGLRRKSNQDRYLKQGTTFAVADGMGGLSGGAEAAQNAVASALRRKSGFGPGATLAEWETMVRAINSDVRSEMQDLGLTKAGSTLTMATIESGRVVATHVGDSRLYEYAPATGALQQRTVDHNLRNELERLGKSLKQAAERGLPLAGLVSYIGMPDNDLRVDVFSWSPEPRTRLLLCSDGVHGCLANTEIAQVLATFAANEAATELTQRADAAGGRDNATAIVVEL